MTEATNTVLDRRAAQERANTHFRFPRDLLQEVINYSTGMLGRCFSSIPTDATPDVGVAHIFLFRQVIELADTIEVMLSRGCVSPIRVVLRSMFESTVSLQYQLESEDDIDRRTLSWVQADIRQRRRASERIRDFEISDELTEKMPPEVQDDVLNHIDAMTVALNKPHMREVVEEYDRVRKQRRKWKQGGAPRWYSLFEGPRSFELLAKRFHWSDLYDISYREWSAVLHGQGGVQEIFQSAEGGSTTLKGLRYPIDTIYFMVNLAANFLLQAIIIISNEYRPDEANERNAWYMTEIKPKLDKLGKMKLTIERETLEW